ncbi:amidase [Nocardioides sp. LS1]|uniref:amidase n=1 Tax=Nocardioides sp. LS1 TaxID=1027620 RepID=UPI000F61DF70|nr:amidase [Nocardioides sp. LS1]GCD88033.1 glutamyl-tRNA(Gln) amidotransferase subunit A [Nocardioides sp. LS1]
MPDRPPDLHRLSASSLIAGFTSGAFSPPEVADALLERINGLDDQLNSFTSVNVFARLHAEYSAHRIASGRARPLEGVPVAVKDLIDTDFLPTTYGAAIYRGHQPGANAEVVQRLLDAGAVIIGKTATHEFAWGVTTDNPHFGPTRNPWDPTRVPGGSSGGSAAALAAGFCPVAIGTDTAGSIRIPAALCGVAGLRPTYESVSAIGVHALAPTLDTVGPMARTVADLRLVAQVLNPGLSYDDAGQKRLRVAAVQGTGGQETGRAAVQLAVDLLRTDPRFEVVELDAALPAFDPYALMSTIVLAEGLRTHRSRGTWPSQAGRYGADVRQRLEYAGRLSDADYERAMEQRSELTAKVRRLMQNVDVLVGPIVHVPPRKVEDRSPEVETAFRTGVMTDAALQSLTGLPSCVVPVGVAEGLPVAVQCTADLGRDAWAMSVAEAIDSAVGDDVTPPMLRPDGPC